MKPYSDDLRRRIIEAIQKNQDLNPIEKCRSKIKTALRAAKARTREALEKALKEVLHSSQRRTRQNGFRVAVIHSTDS